MLPRLIVLAFFLGVSLNYSRRFSLKFTREKPSHMLFGSYDLSIVSDTAAWHYTPVIRHARGQLRCSPCNSGTDEPQSSCSLVLLEVAVAMIRGCCSFANPSAWSALFLIFCRSTMPLRAFVGR